MAHTPLLDTLRRSLRLAMDCERQGVSTSEGFERREEGEHRLTRRRLLGVGATAALTSAVAPARRAAAARPPRNPNASVAVVGAGLAGLVTASELAGRGLSPFVYDANTRLGGRCYSLRGLFPGQVAERGGELIDNLHKTMLGYVRSFGLTLEDLSREPGEVFYHFGGQRHPESAVVNEYRAFVPALQADLRTLSNQPTADRHTANDARLDNVSLRAYLDGTNARGLVCGPIAREAIIQAYIAEYGLEADQQSVLNFLFFIHADRRSTFKPFGVFSDERYHVIEGNDAITSGLAASLPRPVELDRRLVRVARTSSGQVELTFRRSSGGSSINSLHDAVVLAIPFSVLRGVELHPSLNLPAWKRHAIDHLGYGMNAKTMVGFGSRAWVSAGSNGAAYADLGNVQTTWETNPSRANATRGVLTDYAGAGRAVALQTNRVEQQVSAFLTDLDRVFPGARAAASRVNNRYLAHLEHWPSDPRVLGSYTCYTPGQFTTIAGNEAKPVGNLFFAGEHTDSFYEWQGFMEGACLSGIRAASEVIALV